MMWDCIFACGDGLVIGEDFETMIYKPSLSIIDKFQQIELILTVCSKEQCDDGGLDAFDGCDATCKVCGLRFSVNFEAP